jgi:two-component system, NarL family, nitrate/nitrite response regulator NarL
MISPADGNTAAPNRPVRVLIADDHPLYRDGITKVLRSAGFQLVGEAADGEQALQEIRRTQPDVAVLDLMLPKRDAIEVLEALEQEGPSTKVMIVSAYEDRTMVYRAIAAGARAYLLKLVKGEALCEAVLAVNRGETVIPPQLQGALADELRSRRDRPDEPKLTARELEILRLAADGRSTKEIADELFLAVTTVKTHLQHIYEKLEVPDRVAAVAKVMRRGWLT